MGQMSRIKFNFYVTKGTYRPSWYRYNESSSPIYTEKLSSPMW